MKDIKLPVTCHQKKERSHFIYLNSKIMDQMVSRLSVSVQVSFIKNSTHKGIGQRLIGFCVSVVIPRFATGDVLVYFQ